MIRIARVQHIIAPAALGLAGLMAPNAAWASLSCDDIMNMVNVNVPTSIIVQTMKDSGDQFDMSEVKCLEQKGAPTEVIEQAKKMLPSVVPEPPPQPATQTPAPHRPSMEEDQDVIGGRAGRVSAYEALPEKGGRTERSPVEIRDAIKLLRAKKPLTASLMLFDMLQNNSYPGQEAKIDYYLARALGELEMYDTAQYFYTEVIKKGPSNPYFEYALPKLVIIAEYTGDHNLLTRIVAKLPPSAYPRSARNHLYYLKGVQYFEQGELSNADKYFAQISTRSDLYLKARYFQGVIYNKQGRLKSAVRAFRDVYRQNVEVYNDPRQLEQVSRLKDLALINVARIYYGIQRFDTASKYYELVDHNSIYWPEALFENAWSYFMQNRLNDALGDILTIRSPFFTDDHFIPEANILRALTFFNLCDYSQVEKELKSFEAKYKPMNAEMRNFVKSYATPEGRALADQAWDTYFGPRTKKDSVLPRALFSRILRNNDLAGIVRHMELLDKEEALIDDQKPRWRDAIGTYLKKVIERDRTNLKRRAGLLLLSEMAKQANYLSDLLAQSQIIRFEVVDAQRVDYQYKMQNPDLNNSFGNRQIDFATSSDYVYWPFNGEFWQDELGYYHYTEQASCK